MVSKHASRHEVAALRRRLAMSQGTLAEAAGLTRQYVALLEVGLRSSQRTLDALMHTLRRLRRSGDYQRRDPRGRA